MITREQISFEKNKNFIQIAKLSGEIGNHIFLTFFKAFIIAGFLSGLLVFLEFLDLFYFEGFSFVFRLFLFGGIISFVLFVFLSRYFKDEEDKNNLKQEQKNYEVYEISDLDLSRIIGNVGKENIDLPKLFTRILTSKRGLFIAREMGLTREQADRILEGREILPDGEVLKEAFAFAITNALEEDEPRVTAGDLLYGFLKSSKNYEAVLLELEISDEDVKNIIFWENNLFYKIFRPLTLLDKMKASGAGVGQNWAAGYTLSLDFFGYDIANPRYFGGFSVLGRESYILEIENILSKSQKDNCVIVGESGVGKTALVSGLAEKIYWGQTLPELRYKRVVRLDVSALISRAGSAGEIESRIISVFNDAVRAGNIILFIDEIHTLFENTGAAGTFDATEVIISYLKESNIKFIGTTTNSHYETYIQPKSALAGSFEKIELPETTEVETIRILEDLSMYYSVKFGISITYNALKEIYSLADRFITNKGFPSKAIDMLDNVCTAAKNLGSRNLDKHMVDKVAETILNVPVAQATAGEGETLLNLESQIHKRVIGQDEAVSSVSSALRRARANVSSKKRPIGSFLFLGPTGVGKTELSKALAESYFGNENSMIRMDMNEYQDRSSVIRFIGQKTPGVEELEGGEFIKKVKENPFSVILLDEIEKAHPDILNLFLQALDEGYITDGMGEKVILTNSIIIATSNAGANMIRDGVLENVLQAKLKADVIRLLQDKNIFRPEFLNRFDDIILFSPLSREDILKIAGLMFEEEKKILKEKGYTVNIAEGVLGKIAELGFQPEMGARPMRRVFQDKIENFIANKTLDGSLKKGGEVTIELEDIS